MVFKFIILFTDFLFFIDTATTEIYTYRHTLSLHDALPISRHRRAAVASRPSRPDRRDAPARLYTTPVRSEEHTSELQSLMRISYAVFCLKKKNKNLYTTYIPIASTTDTT